MQGHQLRAQIQAFAYLAEIEAMKAENAKREREGLAQAYCESNFFAIANQLTELAHEAAQTY